MPPNANEKNRRRLIFQPFALVAMSKTGELQAYEWQLTAGFCHYGMSC